MRILKILQLLGQTAFACLWRGLLGSRCPDCNVRPLKLHLADCKIGSWDGGIWA